MRSLESDHVAWIEPGHWLGQTVVAPGGITAVNVDLVGAPDDLVGRLELCTTDGAVLAGRDLVTGTYTWDRFAHFLEAHAGPGEYLIRVSVQRGRLGWPTLSHPGRPVADDGVSLLPVPGRAVRDGVGKPDIRAIGIETTPASNPVLRTRFTVDGVREARLHAVGLG